MLLGEAFEIGEIACGLEEDLAVSRPPHPFSCRAIRRDVDGIAFQRPEGVSVEPRNQGVGAFEGGCLLEIGVDGDLFEILFSEAFDIGRDFDVAIAEEGKAGLVDVLSLLAEIVDLLERTFLSFVGALDVFEGDVAFFVQELAEDQMDSLSFPGMDAEGEDAGEVLTEGEDIVSLSERCHRLGQETFLFPYGDIVREGKVASLLDDTCFFGVGIELVGIDLFSVFEIGETDRAVIRPVERSVRKDCLRLSVLIGQLELKEESRPLAEGVPSPLGADAAAEPAVGQFHLQPVAPDEKVAFDVVALDLYPFSVVGRSRCEQEFVVSLSVQGEGIETEGGDVEPCLFGQFVQVEFLEEAVDGIAPFLARTVIAADPFCGENAFFWGDLETSFLAFRSPDAVFVLDLDGEVDGLPALEPVEVMEHVRRLPLQKEGGAVYRSFDPIGLLSFPALQSPCRPRRPVSQRQDIFQAVDSDADGFHLFSSFFSRSRRKSSRSQRSWRFSW